MFLHHALVEAVLIGEIGIPCSNTFKQQYENCLQPDTRSGLSKIEHEYQVITFINQIMNLEKLSNRPFFYCFGLKWKTDNISTESILAVPG